MKKALAQNPNLLRTLIGLGLTLILLLAYAVYGATVSPSYYIYESHSIENEVELGDPDRFYDEEENKTTWTWDSNLNGTNLTWVNLSGTQLVIGATMTISNAGGFYGHRDLGNPDAEKFSCETECSNLTAHSTLIDSTQEGEIILLTSPNPAIRGKGAVYADDLVEAEKKSRDIISNIHTPISVKITIIENGSRNVSPSVNLTQVNEEFSDVTQFEVDTATEFMWALAAVIGCFSMVLVPSFTLYIAARAKQKRTEIKMERATISLGISEE
ncbi:MAG: hypothetical protein QGI21_03170 [Candidatus Poseidoniaceae archaeon]|jgi:hypothetical protein|nr:hypothetical protein [Candidatus Poseidoniaceae archaeon]